MRRLESRRVDPHPIHSSVGGRLEGLTHSGDPRRCSRTLSSYRMVIVAARRGGRASALVLRDVVGGYVPSWMTARGSKGERARRGAGKAAATCRSEKAHSDGWAEVAGAEAEKLNGDGGGLARDVVCWSTARCVRQNRTMIERKCSSLEY